MFDDKSTVYFNPGSVGLNNGSNTVYMVLLPLMKRNFSRESEISVQ